MLNSGQNRRFFCPYDHDIWRITSKNNRTYLLCHFTLWNAQFGLKSSFFLSRVTLKLDGWPWKTIGHLFCTTSSFAHHLVVICELKLELQTLKNNRASLLYDFQLCASFGGHLWIEIGVTVRKHSNWSKTCFDLSDLDFWPLILTICMGIPSVKSSIFVDISSEVKELEALQRSASASVDVKPNKYTSSTAFEAVFPTSLCLS